MMINCGPGPRHNPSDTKINRHLCQPRIGWSRVRPLSLRTIAREKPMLTPIRNAFSQLDLLCDDNSGVTAIEYGLIAGAIAVAIVAVLLVLGQDVSNLFQATSDALQQVS